VGTTPNPKAGVNYYDASYGNFHSKLYGEIRLAAFGEDIGQSGWQTAGEQDQFLPMLSLASGRTTPSFVRINPKSRDTNSGVGD
jgi:hypothetical protein